MANAPEDLQSTQRDLSRAFGLIDDQREKHTVGKEMYDGTRQEVAASRAIRDLIQRNDGDKHTLSIAHVPVDALFDRVELQGVTAEDTAANDVLTAVQDANELEDEYDDWHRKAGYFGDYYVIVDPAAIVLAEDGARVAPEDIDVVGKSPLDTIMVYDAKTKREALYGATRWRDGDEWHAILFYDDRSVFLTADAGANADAPNADQWTWEVEQDPDNPLDPEALIETARPAHPGGRKLIVHIAIDSKPYGTPVHIKAYGPQESITKINAINLVNVDGQGLGARWALEDPGKEIDDDIDDDFGTNGPSTVKADGDGQNAVARRAVRSVPGQIALLKGIKQVGQFEAAQSTEFTGNLEWYIRITAVITGTPLFEFDLSGEQPSGESRRRAEVRINKHARKVQRALGRAHEQVADIVLGLAGLESAVSATFLPVETSTDKEGFELIAQKIKTGVPIDQAFREAGYTDEQVDEWFPDGDPNVNYDTLVAIAGALQQLGQAKALTVITDEEIRGLLPNIITTARGEGVAPVAAQPSLVPVVTDAAPVDQLATS